MWRKFYASMLAAALQDRHNPRYRKDAELWLLRYAPAKKNVQ